MPPDTTTRNRLANAHLKKRGGVAASPNGKPSAGAAGATGTVGGGRHLSGQLTQSQQLMALASDLSLWHTQEGREYATASIAGHREHWPIRSGQCRDFLTRRFYELYEKPPGSQAVKDAQDVLAAHASFVGGEQAIALRVGEDATNLYLDLCNSQYDVVRLTGSGWEIVTDTSVCFRRAKGMLPLPRPVRGANMAALRRFVNVANAGDFALFVSVLLAAYRRTGPYPILVIQGEQGSAKSTTARIFRALTDPSVAPLRSLPRDERDLMISANNSHVQCFDNLSDIRDQQADWLCRLSTGGGWATRELYENDAEMIFHAQRPVVLNGIDDLARRDDLRDRAVILEQPPIRNSKRRDETSFWREFEVNRPAILGALLDAVCVAHRESEGFKIANAPRLADFAKWAGAAESRLWKRKKFLDAYNKNRRQAATYAIEHSALAEELLALAGETAWTGVTKDLLAAVNARVTEEKRKARDWPKSPRGLTNALKRLAPALRASGFELTMPDRDKGSRDLTLRKVPAPKGSTGSTGSPAGNAGTTGDAPMFSNGQYELDERPAIAVENAMDVPF